MKQRACTIKDVAKLAGVSVGTASKVINNIYVRPDAKEKVERAVAELNYVPNAMARGLKVQHTRTIGVMIPDISKSVNNRVLRGISDACTSHGYSLLISDFNLSEEAVFRILQTFIEKKVDGIIYASNAISPELEEAMIASGIPIVLIMTSAGNSKFPRLTIDNEEAAYTLTRKMVEMGHRDILLLCGDTDDINAGYPRMMGYRRALEESNIPIREDMIWVGSFEYERGYKDTKKALQEGLKFTAIAGACDLVAMGAIKALHEQGIRVPEDVSVVGFDGIDASRYFVPELTTIHQPFKPYGEESVHLLVRMLEEGIKGEDIRLSYRYQAGGTIGPVCKEQGQ